MQYTEAAAVRFLLREVDDSFVDLEKSTPQLSVCEFSISSQRLRAYCRQPVSVIFLWQGDSCATVASRRCFEPTKGISYRAHRSWIASQAPLQVESTMTNAFTIRRADERDAASLEVCFDELQSFERSIEANRAEPSLIRKAYLRGLFDDCAKSSGAIFVAEVSNRVVGFVCVLSRQDSEDILERDREHAYVTDLVVLEPYRKAGIASELMRVAEAHAFSSGARRLRVGVLAANSGAHNLYRKLGYRDQAIVVEKTLG